ncbi:MAG: AAA family ATPase [Candidatus Methanofastidiosa archaeon]|nr:AAA family ATPase [Candidatus Methanofastidiosa archaeon]
MKLQKVEFINYKSIKNGTIDIEDDITCLVGVNESGKSNILFALEKTDLEKKLEPIEYSRHSNDYTKGDQIPEIKLWLKPTKDEKKNFEKVIGINDIPYILLRKKENNYSLDYPAINFEKSVLRVKVDQESNTAIPNNLPVNEASAITEGQELTRKNVIEEILKYLPRFLRFDSVAFNDYFLPDKGEVLISELISNQEINKPVRNLLILGGINDFTLLNAGNEDQRIRRDHLLNKASAKINNEILHIIWPVESVEVELSADGLILKIRLKEKGKTSPFKPMERSRGLQWALAFNIYFLAEMNKEIKNAILLIDEPGIFLHINAQEKLLKETFKRIVDNGNQIIYTTHLPYLIDSKYPERIRILEKKDENTEIGNKAWSEGEFGKIPEPIKTALGLRWAELFNVDEKNVVVEGPSDQIILRQLNILLKIDNEINFLPAYGYKKYPATLANIKIEGKKYYGLLDGDVDIEDIRKKSSLVSIEKNRFGNIPSLLNDNKIVTIEDIIPKNIIIDAVFNVYKPICDRRSKCKLEKNEIVLSSPCVKSLEEIFSKKFNTNSHKLLKMDIAREIIKLLDKMEPIVDESEFEIPKKLLSILHDKFGNEEINDN